MALLINKQISLFNDIEISNLYLRFKINYDMPGNRLDIYPRIYTSKIAYDTNIEYNAINGIDGLPPVLSVNYNRELDGPDVLIVAHEKYTEYITTDTFISVPKVDISTGFTETDPSTGEIIYHDIVQRSRFADIEDVSIVDIIV